MASSGNVGRASYKTERPHSSGNGSVSLRNNGGGAQGQQHSARPKAPMSSSRRSVTPISRTRSLPLEDDPDGVRVTCRIIDVGVSVLQLNALAREAELCYSERVRVAVRLRPKNAEELADSDYSDCVELQPELKRLKLRKNNWSSESYRFDEVFTESASQRRIYEVVAKPVVESVLDGCNGTVMAYGQTGTGKTYTLGRLGKEDESERGIMVRAMEDILAGTSTSDCVEVSYLQAMKVVNMVKVKEEFDYESLCRKLETQVDHLTVEIDRQQKLRENEKNEMKKLLEGFENSTAQAEKRFVARSELLEKENAKLTLHVKELLQELESQKEQNKLLLDEITRLVTSVRNSKETLKNELHAVRQTLQAEERRRRKAETELVNVMKVVPESEDGFEEKISYMHENTTKTTSVGLQKILSLLQSEDLDVQIHAVKVVANLAAEDINQERIVQEGGLDALLILVELSQNITILRVASGAIANLAMNEMNQGLITNKGGAKLLADVASKTDDPQTLRMVAGAIANLCGNEKLHVVLKEDGAIKALLGMTRSGNADVIAQVARGLANFAKCESRRIMQGRFKGRSLLMDDGALPWLVANLNTSSTATRRHMELAICHLAQNEDNAKDFITSGCLKELIGISDESAREDIRNLAKKTLRSSPLFRAELLAE
ncbi:UNVERIFIED_CONTAM: Kinesin-like protein KIN-UC [Sesamum radiatum]|uniref:Vacuolar protein 8 n=1 Tax=Sesamum radiatum TaxID=300843 RepID=A0AAW2KBD6_SESRA